MKKRVKDPFYYKDGEWCWLNRKTGGLEKISLEQMYEIKYGRQFSPEEIARCEARENELREQIKQFKADGVKVVKLVAPDGHGKGYEELIGSCFYVKDLIRKKFLTVHPFASNYFEECDTYGSPQETEDNCDCTQFIWKPKEWF